MNAKVRAGDVAGTLAVDRYRKITIKRKKYRAHQLAWLYMTGEWCPLLIDHRDGDPSNNRWGNLRRATVSQSNANRGPSSKQCVRVEGRLATPIEMARNHS